VHLAYLADLHLALGKGKELSLLQKKPEQYDRKF
jgi:hypothetical protein